jgi:excisionase family DNA binding protein
MSEILESNCDILWGVEAIASALNRTPRSVYHLLERGHLPATKMGGRWCVSRRSLLALFEVAPAAERVAA